MDFLCYLGYTHLDFTLRGVAQLASAPGLGPGGRRFESFHPDHNKNLHAWVFIYVRGVAQLGSARRSGRRGRGFKSRHPDQLVIVFRLP